MQHMMGEYRRHIRHRRQRDIVHSHCITSHNFSIFMASLERRFECRLLGGDSPREGGTWWAMFKRSGAHSFFGGSISKGDLGRCEASAILK